MRLKDLTAGQKKFFASLLADMTEILANQGCSEIEPDLLNTLSEAEKKC